MIAPFACQAEMSRGRLFLESMSTFRSPYQRDRDRIIHSSAFRRLKHKTQVFIEHEGDYYRTRLTHSIEVAQVARTIASALNLNTDLAEAIALAHDLGHTPFGHTGEDALCAAMIPYGGFDHNAQALRIVTRLERHYADFDGLNLSWETLEGLAKHNGPLTGPFADEKHQNAPLSYAMREANEAWDLDLGTFASAEAQVAAISDDIAYSHHDLHDGLRSGLFNEGDLMALPVTGPAFCDVDSLYPGLDPMRRRHEALRRVFGVMVEDVLAVARANLSAAHPSSVDDIRAMEASVIGFSKPLYEGLKEIRSFLFARLYHAPSVMKVREHVSQVLRDLFHCFLNSPNLLPQEWREDLSGACDKTQTARIVADYVAGMTDRFALQEHERLCGTSK